MYVHKRTTVVLGMELCVVFDWTRLHKVAYISTPFNVAPALPDLEGVALQLPSIVVLHSLPQVLPHGFPLAGKIVPLKHCKCHQVALMGVVACCSIG